MDKQLQKQIQAWHEADEHDAIIDALTKIELSELGVQGRGWLARAYNNIGDYGSALTHLLAIESASQADWIWYYRMGYAYQGLEQWREAQRYFEHALELNPQDEDCACFIERCLEMRTLKNRFQELYQWLAEYERELDGEASDEERQSLWREAIDILYPSLSYQHLEDGKVSVEAPSPEINQILSRALACENVLSRESKWSIVSPLLPSSDYSATVTPELIQELNQIGVHRATLDIHFCEVEQRDAVLERIVSLLREWGEVMLLGRVLSVREGKEAGLYHIDLETYEEREYCYLMAMMPEREDWFAEMNAAGNTTMTIHLYHADAPTSIQLYPIDPIEGTEDEIIPEYVYTEEEIDAIEAHINEHFGESDSVFHEIVSPDIHLDLYLVEPSKERPYYTIVTVGMGAYEMNVPEELLDYQMQRAELVICLPPTWEFKSDKERDYWPLRLLKSIARLPIYNNGWLAWGHSITNEEPYDNSAPFSGCMLVNPVASSEDANACVLPSGDEVNFYQIIPLYEAEMQYKVKNGAQSLLDLMRHVSHVLDPKRPCVVDKLGESPSDVNKIFS